MKIKHLLSITPFILALLVVLISCEQEDTKPPIIILNGDQVLNIALNGTIPEPGYEAYDDEDGNLTYMVEVVYPSSDKIGTYDILYTVSDAAGNADSARRWVTIKNEAALFSGTFRVEYAEYPGGTPVLDTLAASSDPFTNKKITLGNFSGHGIDLSGMWKQVPGSEDRLYDIEITEGEIEVHYNTISQNRFYFDYTLNGQRYITSYTRI